MSALKAPIHTAEINGQPVRFFEPPADRSDFLWIAEEDIYRAAGFPRDLRRHLAREMANAPGGNPTRTIATPDGILRIVPHFAAQGLFEAADDASGTSALRDYRRAGVAAFKILTQGWPADAVMECLKSQFSRSKA